MASKRNALGHSSQRPNRYDRVERVSQTQKTTLSFLKENSSTYHGEIRRPLSRSKTGTQQTYTQKSFVDDSTVKSTTTADSNYRFSGRKLYPSAKSIFTDSKVRSTTTADSDDPLWSTSLISPSRAYEYPQTKQLKSHAAGSRLKTNTSALSKVIPAGDYGTADGLRKLTLSPTITQTVRQSACSVSQTVRQKDREQTFDQSSCQKANSMFEGLFTSKQLEGTDSPYGYLKVKEEEQRNFASSAVNVQSLAQGKAIPLCLPNNLIWDPATGEIQTTEGSRRSLCPVPIAVEVLRSIKEPVCVVSVAGPCREGKSYILSEVFGGKDVFSIGHEMDPETMGLWMWVVPETFKDSAGRDFTVILLDSEGINAVTAEGQSDNQIFTLTVLLASVLIYNSKGVPKRNDLNDLDFIVKLSQRIRIQSKGGIDDENLFQNTFPFFIWLLRDVAQKLPSDCKDINEYFSTRVFKETANATITEKGQQKVTESILTMFSGFEAFSLPSPSSDDDIMQDISNSKEKLNPKFLKGLERFESLLKSKLFPKPSINKGEKITGEALGALVMLYSEAINDPTTVPNVEKAWDTFVKNKCEKAKEEALKIYDREMEQRMTSCLPCEEHLILKNHKISQRRSMEIFERETAELMSTSIDRELTLLMKSTDKHMKTWKEKNAERTRTHCEYLLQRLKKTYLDPVLKGVGNRYANVRYADITNSWDTVKTEFDKQATGAHSVRANVFYKFNKNLEEEILKYKDILWKMKDYDDDLAEERKATAYQEREKTRLQKEIAQVQRKEESLQRKMTMLNRRQEQEINAMRDQAFAEKQELQRKMDTMQHAGERIQSQIQAQLNAAKRREAEANQSLWFLQSRYDQERERARDQKNESDRKIQALRQQNQQTHAQLQSQINSYASRERQNNCYIQNLNQKYENERRSLARLRDEKETLQWELDEANKPGFFRRIWKKLF